MTRYVLPIIVFAVLAFFLGLALELDPRAMPSPLIGKPAPSFAAPALAEPAKTLRNRDLLGKVWILNVWASSCEACRDEPALLAEISRRRQVPVIGLNYRDQREHGLQWLQRFGNPYTDSLFDPQGRVAVDYGVGSAPETFIIDKSGIVRLKHVGPVTPEVLKSHIDPILKELDD